MDENNNFLELNSDKTIINNFILLKNIPANLELDNDTLKLLDDLFSTNLNKKTKKIKKNNNILKNNKLQRKKDNISSKVNLILNKLSENNINNLVIEFIESINQVDIENFEEIQKIFYLKIINEINFIKIYLDFFKIIGYLYKIVQNYNLEFFYNTIEIKFNLDYNNLKQDLINDKYSFINELNCENKRLNNLILIKKLVDHNFLSNHLINECDNIILNQNLYLSDIYYWYNNKDNYTLSLEDNDKIKNIILNNNNLNSRDKILLECLIDNKKNSNKNIFNLEIYNLLNNFIKNNSDIELINNNEISNFKFIDEVISFINKTCNDSISKNKFCEIIFIYFLNEINVEKNYFLFEILLLHLIKNNFLLKSNICQGLILMEKNNNNSNAKIKILLNIFKNNGITKNIEYIFEKYNIY
jgi:hypothetical protein